MTIFDRLYDNKTTNIKSQNLQSMYNSTLFYMFNTTLIYVFLNLLIVNSDARIVELS